MLLIIPEGKVHSGSPIPISFMWVRFHHREKEMAGRFSLMRKSDSTDHIPHSSSQNPLCLHLHFYWIWEDGAEIPELQPVPWGYKCTAVCPQIWLVCLLQLCPSCAEGVLCVCSCCPKPHWHLLGNLLQYRVASSLLVCAQFTLEGYYDLWLKGVQRSSPPAWSWVAASVPLRPGCRTVPLQSSLKWLQKQHLSAAQCCSEYDCISAGPEPLILQLYWSGAWLHSARCCTEECVHYTAGTLTYCCTAPCRHTPGILNFLCIMYTPVRQVAESIFSRWEALVSVLL